MPFIHLQTNINSVFPRRVFLGSSDFQNKSEYFPVQKHYFLHVLSWV